MIHGLLGAIGYFSPRCHLGGLAVFTSDQLGYDTNAEQVSAAEIDLHKQRDAILNNISNKMKPSQYRAQPQ